MREPTEDELRELDALAARFVEIEHPPKLPDIFVAKDCFPPLPSAIRFTVATTRESRALLDAWLGAILAGRDPLGVDSLADPERGA